MFSKLNEIWRRGVYRRVLQYLKPYRRTFLGGMLCMLVFGATDGGIPFLVQRILDGVFARENPGLLYLLPVVVIGFALVRAASDFGQSYLMAKAGHNVVRDLRNEVNRHFLGLSPQFFIANSSANLLSRITSDVVLMRTLLTDSLAAIVRDSIRVVALLAAAIYLDWLLALIAFVVFPIGIIPVYRFGKRMRRLSRQGQEAIGSLSGLMHESIVGNKVVKIFGREQYEERRFRAENDRVNTTFLKSEKVRAVSGPINEVLASFAISGVILYGGYSVIGGLRTQGEFLAFLVAVFLLYDPFKKLSRVNSVIQQGMSGADRIFEILNTPPAIVTPPNPLPLGPGNEIEFEHVSFSYKEGNEPALHDITLSIAEGHKTAFVGFSGAGKSTLVDLIPRFIEPQQGIVRVGGVDVTRVSLTELRGRIAMVGQQTFLFNDTIFNNIAYGREGASVEEVTRAAKAAYAYDFIMALPHGFDTIVGEGGLALSGGERQRLAIARAILKDAPILILDEATAALDNRSEREVQAALEALQAGKTSLIIAHRLSTVRNADKIVVLSGGKIVEQGRHEDLLAACGEYQRLYQLQFQDAREGTDAQPAAVN